MILVLYFLLVLKLLKLFKLFYSMILNCFYFFYKCFTAWRICKFSLFYCSSLIRWYLSSPVRYSYSCYSSMLPVNNADIFAAFLLISYCSLSSLTLLSISMIGLYILSKIFFLKREELSYSMSQE